YGLVTGTMDMLDSSKSTGERALGGVNAGLGSIGTAGGIANMLNVAAAAPGATGLLATGQNLLYGMTSMGGAGLGGGGLAGSVGEAATWFGTSAGGAGAGSAVGLGTALSTVGGVASAGLAGYGIGSFANSHAANSHIFGHKADGTGKTVSDWA